MSTLRSVPEVCARAAPVWMPARSGKSREKRKVGKGAWRMPWLQEAMKDVISCEKRGVGANGP